MRFTDIIVDHDAGYLRVRTPTPPVRREVFRSFPGVPAEAQAKAEAELETYGNGQTETTVELDTPGADPTPTIDWVEGDTITVDGVDLVCVAITATLEDGTNLWTDVPQFGVKFDGDNQRAARAVLNIGGVGNGTSRLARPVNPHPPADVRPTPIDSGSG